MSQGPLDLTNCDREPIHIPGSIQAHGVLLALAEDTEHIVQVSANTASHLALSADHVLGMRLPKLLGTAAASDVALLLHEERWDELNPLLIAAHGKTFDGIVHRYQGAAVLELEPRVSRAASDVHQPLRLTLNSIQRATSLEELCQCVVLEVRKLTGFERVLLYRFTDEGHGSVEAEVKEDGLEAYLGLHYPASDIPRQARELYLRNWLRFIPDARYSPVPIVPTLRPDTGKPLDLSYAVLRSVSPIHLEYLANMGIRASMSVSLIVRDRLWGLISCSQHSGARFVPYEVRAACEVLARVASLQISAFADREHSRQRVARAPLHTELAQGMRRNETRDVLAGLASSPQELLEIVNADGAAVLASDEVLLCGRTPPRERCLEIGELLHGQPDSSVFCTTCLESLDPAAVGEREAAGVLSFSLPGPIRRRVLWFRREVIATVNWGGDPTKPVALGAEQRLHPRRSFELWKQEVRGHSRPWTESDVEAAEELRRRAIETDLVRQVAREQRAVRARDDVVAVVSHDLKNPLAVIQTQTTMLQHKALEDGDASARLRSGLERIERAVLTMTALIGGLLDQSSIEAGRFTLHKRAEDVGVVIAEALVLLRPLAEAKHIRLENQLVEGPRLHVDRERLFQVLSNLVGNAIEFTPERGTVFVRTAWEETELVCAITDTGPGIPADVLPHVFDRYWKARTTSRRGSGLGLYISKGIVEAHGGRIWVETRSGGGSTFVFTLPVSPA